MIFAAGRGERMRPLSDAMPKPALPVADKPVVASTLRLAAEAGCRSIAVNTWHLADLMESAVRGCELGRVTVGISREEARMGTAGGLALARDRGLLGRDGPVLVLNGDCLLNLSLEPLFERFAVRGDLVTLGLLPHLEPARWSRVLLETHGLVSEILPPGRPNNGEVPLLYPGAMVVSRQALDSLSTTPHGVGEGLWRPARAARKLGGAVVPGHWREVGTPADYLEAVLRQIQGRPFVDSSANIEAGASLGAAFIGRGARIGADAVIGESVVAEGAVVRRGARVIRSVLLGPVETASGECVVDEFRVRPLIE